MFSNGDAWNGTIAYGTAFVTSPSLWLGVGIGKIAGVAGTKATGLGVKALATKATQEAIEAGAKQIVKKSAGKITMQAARSDLTAMAAKGAARYQIAGALAVEAPLAGIQDYLLQDIRMDTGVQDEYSFLQTATSMVLGAAGAVPGIYTLRKSASSTFANTSELLDEAYKTRAKTSAKRAAPKIKAALEKSS